MYWHIDTDIIALLVTCALYIYINKTLPRKDRLLQNQGFIWCLRAGIVMLAVDIAASVVMEVPTTLFLYHLLMTAYLLVIQMVIVSWFIYSLTILYQDDQRRRKRAIWLVSLPYMAYGLLVCSNPWTRIFYSLTPELVYTREVMFVPLTVGVYAIYALALIGLIVARRRHIPENYPRVILLIQPFILALSIPAQLLNPGWLVIVPAYTLCLVLAFLFFQNVSIRTEQDQLRMLSELVENFSSGVAICAVDKEGRQRVQYLSPGYAAMCQEDPAFLLERYQEDMLYGIHPEDRELVTSYQDEATATLGDQEMIYRYLTRQGNCKWLRVQTKALTHEDGTATIYATYTDLTQQKLFERQLSDVIKNVPCGICIFRWDGRDLHPLLVNSRFTEMLGEDALGYLRQMKNLRFTHLHPEDRERLREDIIRAMEQTGELNTTYRSLNSQSGQYLWIRLRGKLLTQDDGSQLVLTSFNDVTQEHMAEQQLQVKYELERKRPALKEETLLAHALFDLSSGETLERFYRDGRPVPPEDSTAFGDQDNNAHRLLIDPEERQQYLRLHDADYLLERFSRGETEFVCDFRRLLPSGEVIWVRNTLHLLQEPGSGHVLLFEYWYDIEEEKMMELMYRSLASDNYDFVARINGRTRRFVVFPKSGLTFHMPPLSGEDADAVALSIYGDSVVPEDREMAIHNSLVENINRHLQERGRFQFTYRVRRPDNSLRYKKLTQYYIDPQRLIIAMLREDVTDLIREEGQKNQMLAEALTEARQASEAKSQFLSRVSHELRTPLNAIIGFMELAKDADPQQTETYLTNSDIAAKQLLSIINDVLDMSSIEAGKLKIAHTPFDFRQLVQAITNIYVPQCQQKGLGYETLLLTPVDEWLLGDPLRVNQILLNLLNNAVKFTTQGQVTLKISQREGEDNKVLIRFQVSDSGCGMSPQMLDRLFKPFEQESAVTAQKYGGNGLGLSIVGSLVQLMNGAIRVESQLDKGSTFTVDLPFTRSEAAKDIQPLEDMSELRVLAVDDEAQEREYVSTVLKRLGVRHSSAEDGDTALLELERGHEAGDPYNVCLVDWRMPRMNGMETTRRIRERYGNNVVVIVVSAYDHYQASESARAAGANMFISKPLFQSSLLDLFSTLTGGRAARRDSTPTQRDFRGRRVLLVEDNTLNRLVAEGLIKKFGADCESATDGQQAADKFLAAPAGYYDAILMDIQMPNLDGYGATRAIRASEHPEAASIPIIALTANAFNEDIARTLSSGMNAHVAKPIDPNQLAQALDRAFSR